MVLPYTNKKEINIMFGQSMIYFVIFLIFIVALWKLVIKPILKDQGVQVDDILDETIRTNDTERLEEVKKEKAEASASANAVIDELELVKDIKFHKNTIKETKEKIRKEQ